ncbi:MAG: potassium channel family protein [Pseudomonadota bacterium]
MIAQLLLGGLLVFASIAAQAAFIGVAIAALERLPRPLARAPHGVRLSVIVGLTALWMMAAQAVGVALWALAFLAVDIFDDFDTALYFAGVSFTTLGFGDIIPPVEWRQLAGLCAANGLLVFGVSTAVLVEVLRRFAFTPPPHS